MQDDRIERFLNALRSSGNAEYAAAVASPTCTGPRPGYTTMRVRKRRDPQFKAAWEAALSDYNSAERRAKRLAVSVLDLVEASA